MSTDKPKKSSKTTTNEPVVNPMDNKEKVIELGEEELKKVIDEAKKLLITSKIDLTRKYPFLGSLVMSVGYEFDMSIPTMAATTIPSNRIIVNPVFFNTVFKNRKERVFGVAHEVLHIFCEHISRAMERNYDMMLFNVAADFFINGHLHQIDPSYNHLELPKWVLHDPKYYNMSADEIYFLLLKESENNPNSAAGKYGKVGEFGKDGKQSPMDEISKEKVSEATKLDNQQKVITAIKNAQLDKNIGSGYGNLVNFFSEGLTPKLCWTELLADYMTRAKVNSYTYNRISRKSTNIIFPSITGNHINVAWGIDTSGSMSEDDYTQAASEAQGVMNQFDSWVVNVLTCDTKAHVIDTLFSENCDNITNVNKKLIGGGGTDMTPMVELINELEETPDVLVIVTDGYIPEIKTDSEIPTIVVVTKSGNKKLTLNNYPVIHIE